MILLSIVDLMVSHFVYPIIQGISTAIVLVRVEMGLIYDIADNTKRSKTPIRFISQSYKMDESTTMSTLKSVDERKEGTQNHV